MEKIKNAVEEILLEKDWEINDYQLELFNQIELMQDPDILVSAAIHRKTNKITLKVNPEIEEKLEDIVTITGVKQYFNDALVQLARGLTLHEWGHWQGCPMEDQKALEMASAASPLVYEFLKNYAIKQKMRETGESVPQIKEINKDQVLLSTFQQTNIFTDLIDDTLEAHLDDNKEDYVLGNWLFYVMAGESNQKSAQKRCEAQKSVAKDVIATIRETREKIKEKQAQAAVLEKKLQTDDDNDELLNIQKELTLPNNKEKINFEYLTVEKKLQTDDYHDELLNIQNELTLLNNKEKLNLEYLTEINNKRKTIRKGKFNKHFTLFLNTAAKLYLDEDKEKYWKKYYSEDFPELEEKTLEILTILTDNSQIAQRIANRTATKEDWNKTLHELEYKYAKWPDKNKKIVEILLQYLDLDEQPTGRGLNMFFQNFIENPEDMEEPLKQLATKGAPLHFAQKDAVYNAIYRQKAQEIVMEEIRKDREAGMLKIKDISLRKTTIPSLNGIKWSKTKIKNGEFEFFKEEIPIEIPGNFPKISKNLPDILFMVDTSGSMGWAYAEQNGNIDTNKKMESYDLACTAIHSVVNYLEKSKKAPWMKFGAVTFSYNTQFSGWKEHKNIKEIFKTLYDKENGGTTLDTKVMDEVLKTRSDNFWAIMLTDGVITNENEALAKVQDMVEQGNYFTLIHIGKENSFCKRIKQAYGDDAAVVIDSAEKLSGISLKYTKQMYGAIR